MVAHNDDYEVGYGKTPKGTRFKKGVSGNPKGRPKGTKNKHTVLTEVLSGQIAIRENGEKKVISREEAIWLSSSTMAIKGDLKHAEFIMSWREKLETGKLRSDELDAVCDLIADDAVRQARLDGRLPASGSDKDLILWGEKKGSLEPGTWAMLERNKGCLNW